MTRIAAIVRPTLIFISLAIVASVALAAVVPGLTAWHLANCFSTNTGACAISGAFLTYWWITLIPLLIVCTFVIDWVLGRRRAT